MLPKLWVVATSHVKLYKVRIQSMILFRKRMLNQQNEQTKKTKKLEIQSSSKFMISNYHLKNINEPSTKTQF